MKRLTNNNTLADQIYALETVSGVSAHTIFMEFRKCYAKLKVYEDTAAEAEKKAAMSNMLKEQKRTSRKPPKNKYGEFVNVELTAAEHKTLFERFGEATAQRNIDALSIYMRSKGRQYINHYAAVLNFIKRTTTVPPNTAPKMDYTRTYTEEQLKSNFTDINDIDF